MHLVIDSPARGRALVFIYATIFLDMMGSTLLLPITPYIVRQYDTSALMVGLLTVIYSAAAFLAAPALGKLSDRWGRRPVLLASVLGSALGYLLFGIGGALWVLFISRLVDGLTGGNISTAMAYIADVTKPQERTKFFAFVGLAFGLGFTIGPVLSGALSGISLSAPAYAAAGLSLASFLFGLFFLPESLPREKRSTGSIRLVALNPFSVIGEVAKLPNLKVLFSVVFTLTLAYNGLFIYMAVYTLNRFSATPQDNSILFIVVGIFQMIGQGGLVFRLTPRLGEKRVALIGLFAQALVYPLFVVVPRFWLLYPLAVVGALGNAFTRPTLDSLVANSVAPGEQGRAAGVSAAINSLTSVIGPLLAGLLYDAVAPGALFIAGGLLLALAGALTTWVRADRAVTS